MDNVNESFSRRSVFSAVEKGRLRSGRFVIPYRRYGEQGPTLVCVNGALQTMATWISTVVHLGDSFRLLIYDSPGMARGGIVSGGAAITIREQIEVLDDLIVRLVDRKSPVHLAGASWGSLVAAAYAARYPRKISRLVLASFSVALSPRLRQVIDRSVELYETGRPREGAHVIINAFGEKLPEDFKQRILKQFDALSPTQFESAYHHLLTVANSGPLSAYINLRRIQAETLVINGAEDALAHENDLETIRELMPRARIHLVSGAGHFLHLENEAVFEEYRVFLGCAGRTAPAEPAAVAV